MHTQQDRLSAIEAIRATVRDIWRQACAHDGIDPGAAFAMFSEDNPYADAHDDAQARLQQAIDQHRLVVNSIPVW